MRALILTAALFTLIAESAFAQGSPLSCKKVFNNHMLPISCNITENNTLIQDIVFNRGNCTSPKQNAETIMRNPDFKRYAGNRDLVAELPIGKSFKFGDSFDLLVPIDCNLLEYSITANGKVWTWKAN